MMTLLCGQLVPQAQRLDTARHISRVRPCRCIATGRADAPSCSNKGREVALTSRRRLLEAGLAVLGAAVVGELGQPAAALAGQVPEVGNYLPPAGIDDFVEFVVTKGKTPAVRAGSVDIQQPYRFALPPAWREKQVANIMSGSYCQPRCEEPWQEVIFENDKEGKVVLWVSPLRKLIARANTIRDVGPASRVLNSVGSYITGTLLEEEDVVSVDTKDFDGRPYIIAEVNAVTGTVGPHSISSIATKGELLYLLTVSASDKQWSKSSGKLRKVAESFRV